MNCRNDSATIQALELFEEAPEATLLVGPEGGILLANRHCEAVFGYGAGELCGLQVEALMPTHCRLDHLAWRRAYAASGGAPEPAAAVHCRLDAPRSSPATGCDGFAHGAPLLIAYISD
ncbi:MAG: PAS domain S-box protein [Gammaproteobacteria bacterium]|nr:PAS domain S-box protein [Gammaproteobacteria bacterium]